MRRLDDTSNKLGAVICFTSGLFGIFVSVVWSFLYTEIHKLDFQEQINIYALQLDVKKTYFVGSAICIVFLIKSLVDVFHDCLSCSYCLGSQSEIGSLWYKTWVIIICGALLFGTPITFGISCVYSLHALILIIFWHLITFNLYRNQGCKI